jgi:hypothetical protein
MFHRLLTKSCFSMYKDGAMHSLGLSTQANIIKTSLAHIKPGDPFLCLPLLGQAVSSFGLDSPPANDHAPLDHHIFLKLKRFFILTASRCQRPRIQSFFMLSLGCSDVISGHFSSSSVIARRFPAGFFCDPYALCLSIAVSILPSSFDVISSQPFTSPVVYPTEISQ